MNKYAIIDYINNSAYTYNNDIEMGFALDMILDNLDRYELDYKVTRYNFGKVYVIR